MTAFVKGTARSSRARRTSSTDSFAAACGGIAVHERELVGAEPKRGAHGRVELANGPLAERLDRVVERAGPLHRPVGELHRERPVARVERGALGGGAKDPVGVGVLLEDARRTTSYGDLGAPSRRCSRAPCWSRSLRLTAARADTRPRHAPAPFGLHLQELDVPVDEPASPAARARQTVSGRPSTTPRAPMCGERARMRFISLLRAGATSRARGRRARSSPRTSTPSSGCGVNAGSASTSSRSSTATRRRALVDRARVVLRPDRERPLRGDRARVELGRRPVDRDPGLRVTGHERPLDRSGAAPARQERRVDVQPEALGEEASPGSSAP